MKKDFKFYLKLFLSTLSLSAFTIGGGYVIVPLMRKKFVEKYKWIDENEMIDLIAIAQSSPGAIAVNTSILIGYRLSGIKGSLITIFGTILPPFVIISIISFFYMTFKDSLIIRNLMLGMQAGVSAVILDVVIGMIVNIFKGKSIFLIGLMVIAFVCTFFFKINIILIILFSGTLGLAYYYFIKKKEANKNDLH